MKSLWNKLLLSLKKDTCDFKCDTCKEKCTGSEKELKERRSESRDSIFTHYSNDLTAESLLDSIQIENKERTSQKKLIPDLDLSGINWDKKVILVLDDEELVNFFLEEDLKYFSNIGSKVATNINLNQNELDLLSMADKNGLKDFLMNFEYNKYSIINVTTDYAAYSLRLNLKHIKRVDYAILDISLGGTLLEDSGSTRSCLNGIDSARDLFTLNPNIRLMFYTGNDLGKYSPISKQFKDYFSEKEDLFSYLVNKDTPLIIRRLKFLKFLSHQDFTEVSV